MMGMGWMMMRVVVGGMITKASKGKENYCSGPNSNEYKHNDIQPQPIVMTNFLMIFRTTLRGDAVVMLCPQMRPGVRSSHPSSYSHQLRTKVRHRPRKSSSLLSTDYHQATILQPSLI